MNDAKFDRTLLSQDAQDILQEGRVTDQTDGHSAKVFTSNFIQFPIEGVAWLAGAAEDILQGSADSLRALVTQGDLYNPFSRLVDAKDMQHAAHWERAAKDNITQPLRDLVGLGNVEIKMYDSLAPEEQQAYIDAHNLDEGGYFNGVYTIDGSTYYPLEESVGTAVLASYVADPTTLMAGVGTFSKLKVASEFAEKLNKVAMPSLGLTAAHIGADTISDITSEKSENIKSFLDRFTSDSWYSGLDTDRGIRYMKDDLNELFESEIDQTFDDNSQTGITTLYRSSSEIDPVTSERMYSAIVDIYRYKDREGDSNNLGFKTLNSSVDAQAYESILKLEQKFYNLAEYYVQSPDTFDPSRSDLLTIQAVLASEYKVDGFGEDYRRETFDAFREHLGIKSDTALSADFKQEAMGFIADKKGALSAEFAATAERYDVLQSQNVQNSINALRIH